MPLEVERVEFLKPQVGEDYIIVNSKMRVAETQQGKRDVIDLALEPVERGKDDENIYNDGLWYTKKTTPSSKFGAVYFAIEAYANDNPESGIVASEIDSWQGLIIRILSWEAKNNKILVRGKAEASTVEKLVEEFQKRTTKD